MKQFSLSALSSLVLALGPSAAGEISFVNPIAEGADPWVVQHGEQYLWCFSEGDRGLSVWISDRLTTTGTRHLVWQAPEEGPWSREVWAPELHLLDGRWHIYFAASDGRNENHLAYVLQSADENPLGPYELHGPFATGEGEDGLSPNIWAIDMTILEHEGERYALWSGWDAPGTDQQFLYIAPMASPTELSGPRVLMCANDDFLWERTEEREDSRGLHEAPQVLQHGGRTFVVYSCGASWLGTYKLGLLELTGNDPLDPASWSKHPEPVFQREGGTIGTGHSIWVKSPDESEWWHIFHAKMDEAPGWRRAVFAQPMGFRDDGFPDFGTPTPIGSRLPLPSGQKVGEVGLPLELSLQGSLDGFAYYGHKQFLETGDQGVRLGVVPEAPVNTFRTGEKLVLLDGDSFTDLEASVTVRVLEGDRDAGLLFRVTEPSLGFDAQQAYFAGIMPGSDRVILGRMDGRSWHEIASAETPVAVGEDYRLSIRAIGPDLSVSLDGEELISVRDETHPAGSVGIRVVNTEARFRDLVIAPQ